MRRNVLGALVLSGLLAPISTTANGGGYNFGVAFTGGIAPFQPRGTEQVQIVDEKLAIRLQRVEAAVVVQYSMKNPSGKPAKVRFGFPVEAVRENDLDDSSPGVDERTRRAKAYQQLRGYRVTLDGETVKADFAFEPFGSGLVKPFPGSEALKNIAGWMVSEVDFPASAISSLRISYSAQYFEKGYTVSDDVHGEAPAFVYRLSTGAAWLGSIAHGVVEIQADGVPVEEVEIAAPRKRFKREGSTWRWEFKDLKPTLGDDITVRPYPAQLEVGAYAEADAGYESFVERQGRWGASHRKFSVTASSTLAPSAGHDYSASNLANRTQSTWPDPWCEGVPGNGEGEWVELSPRRPTALMGIKILPGVPRWGKDRELFRANGIPTRLEILLNNEHRFQATLGDIDAEQFIPVIGYAKPVSKVMLKILEVRPGATYQDTCIQSVWLYESRATKPEMRGAR